MSGESIGGSGGPAKSPATWRPGDLLAGELELREGLGAGGTAFVFKALARSLGLEVAVKILIDGSGTRRERLRREGELAAALAHPGIVRVLGEGEHAGYPFLVFELVPGAGLDDVLAEAPLPDAVGALADVAEALDFAHQRGVVHRDVKPANVLVADGRARLLDFGLGLPPETGADRLTRSGAFLGTPGYMAPEQIQDARSVGPAADVWACGVMLFEALAGRHPFAGDSFHATLAAILSAEHREWGRELGGRPVALVSVCAQALAESPADRPSAGEVARRLRAWRAGDDAPARSSWWPAALGLGLSLVLAFGLALRSASPSVEPAAESTSASPSPSQAPGADASAAERPLAERWVTGLELLEAGRWDEVRELWPEPLALPPCPGPHGSDVRGAQELKRLGRFDEAESRLRGVLGQGACEPQWLALSELGDLYLLRGRFDLGLARSCWLRAVAGQSPVAAWQLACSAWPAGDAFGWWPGTPVVAAEPELAIAGAWLAARWYPQSATYPRGLASLESAYAPPTSEAEALRRLWDGVEHRPLGWARVEAPSDVEARWRAEPTPGATRRLLELEDLGVAGERDPAHYEELLLGLTLQPPSRLHPLAYARLAKIYAARGETARAVSHLARAALAGHADSALALAAASAPPAWGWTDERTLPVAPDPALARAALTLVAGSDRPELSTLLAHARAADLPDRPTALRRIWERFPHAR